jgi:hypothetical protein
MEGDEHDARTFTSLGWQALKLVKKLKDHSGERTRGTEAPRAKSREGKSLEETSAPPSEKRREAVKFK